MPAVRLQNGAADVEAQPGALRGARGFIIDALEAVEDAPLLAQRNAHAFIANAEHDRFIRHLSLNADELVLGRIFHGIIQDRKSTRLNSSHIPLSRMPS